ncbi:MAG: CHRD domain-containing protein [Myxococcales bacterium]
MRRFVSAVTGLAMAACATASSSQPEASKAAAGGETFQARLDARNEVPPPTLDANASPSGTASFTVRGTSVAYKVDASGLSGPPVAAHIHTGAPGVAGPVIVPLTVAAGPSAGTATGEGTFDASAVKGKKADGSAMTLDDVLAAMRSGGTYVNVHTANNKPGELRGQIEK